MAMEKHSTEWHKISVPFATFALYTYTDIGKRTGIAAARGKVVGHVALVTTEVGLLRSLTKGIADRVNESRNAVVATTSPNPLLRYHLWSMFGPWRE